MYLSQIITTYVRKDVRDIGNIKSITVFNKLLELLAFQSGQILNILEISNTLAISRETVSEYLDLMENTFIIRRITPFYKNLRSELSKNPKIFFMDTGMMHLLWLKEFPKIIFGNSFETFVFLELMKSHKKIHFWRTTNKQEIDFIIENKGLYAIEVKINFQQGDRRTLRFFSERYKCKSAIVGLQGEKTESSGEEKRKYIWELLRILK